MIGFKKKTSAGFTLIEVMVVVAIIGIMAGVVIASFGDSRVEKELETNAREFVGVVREAQNYALTGKQFVAGTAPCSFRVDWSSASLDYSLTYWYKDASGTCSPPNYLMSAYPLKNGVNFIAIDSVSFSLPHANTGLTTTKIVVFHKGSLYHTVCIYADGRVSDVAGMSTCP